LPPSAAAAAAAGGGGAGAVPPGLRHSIAATLRYLEDPAAPGRQVAGSWLLGLAGQDTEAERAAAARWGAQAGKGEGPECGAQG
jgi:hypothetical protein